MVADRPIKLAHQPIVGRRQRDDAPTRPKMARGAYELGSIVFDVFQNVDVQNGVEQRIGWHIGNRSEDGLRLASPVQRAVSVL